VTRMFAGLQITVNDEMSVSVLHCAQHLLKEYQTFAN